MPIKESDIIREVVPAGARRHIVRMAKAASIGGSSNVRAGADRDQNLSQDQLVGQIGQYVGSRWLYGSSLPYRQSRWLANQNPHEGDGGRDIIGSNIDFKTSLMRADMDIMEYRLAVRPRERHANWVYVLVLVPDIPKRGSIEVFMMGWCSDATLTDKPNGTGPFKGAFTRRAHELNPLPPFRWGWREE